MNLFKLSMVVLLICASCKIPDGKKMKEVDIQDVNFNAIDHLEVYKKKEYIEKYTTEDYDSVIVITLKKNKK